MPTVEDISSGPPQELQASGNRRKPVALFPTDGSPTTTTSPPSHFFIGEVLDRPQGAFAPIRSRAIEGPAQIARATGNRRIEQEALLEGPLGPRADFIVTRRVRPSSLTFTPERRITVGTSPNSRSRERLRAIRLAESASARPSPAVQYELSAAQHVARTLTQEMSNAREHVEHWTAECEQRNQQSEINLLHRFEQAAHVWTESRDAQREQNQRDWMVERGRLEALRTSEVQAVRHQAETAVHKFEADLHTAVALEQLAMNQSLSEAHVQQRHHYQSELTNLTQNLEASASQNDTTQINRLRSELATQAEALQSLSDSSVRSTQKVEESLAQSHDRCVQLNSKVETLCQIPNADMTSLLQEVETLNTKVQTLENANAALENSNVALENTLTARIDNSEK